MTTVRTPKSVYLHVPKTAGSWMVACIQKAGLAKQVYDELAHAPLHRVKEVINDPSLKYWAFVRHPVTWWESYWRDRMTFGWNNGPVNEDCRSEDYQTFMDNVLSNYQCWYSKWVESIVGRPGQIDHIGKFENVEKDFVDILQAIGEELNPQVMNGVSRLRAGDKKFVAKTNPELRRRILQSEHRMAERFEYK